MTMTTAHMKSHVSTTAYDITHHINDMLHVLHQCPTYCYWFTVQHDTGRHLTFPLTITLTQFHNTFQMWEN